MKDFDVLIALCGTIFAFVFTIRQIKQLRIQLFFQTMIDLEKDINETTKEIWGINEKIIILKDGTTMNIDLEELSYMVRYLDIYSCRRAQALLKRKSRTYTSGTLVYKLFLNRKFRIYWKYLVRNNFYPTIKRATFVNAIDKTIKKIELLSSDVV